MIATSGRWFAFPVSMRRISGARTASATAWSGNGRLNNRIKGLLFGQGIRGINVKSKYKTLQIDKLVTGDGRPLPPRLASEITREIARLALTQEQIAALERERDQAPTPCKATERKRVQLMCLTGIGPAIAAVMTPEVYYRQFDNRRQVVQLSRSCNEVPCFWRHVSRGWSAQILPMLLPLAGGSGTVVKFGEFIMIQEAALLAIVADSASFLCVKRAPMSRRVAKRAGAGCRQAQRALAIPVR